MRKKKSKGIQVFEVIRGVVRGGGSEIFVGVKHSNVKQHSNENVWKPKKNLQIQTEIRHKILDKFHQPLHNAVKH
jgi:hypothetical protein